MTETAIQLQAGDGTIDGFFYHPGGGRRPGVIFLTDIGGIRESNRGMARRLAAEGYAVLLPNVFYRTGRPPVMDFPVKMGDEKTVKRLAELREPLTPEAMARDASTYVDYLATRDDVAAGPMGVVGFCFTGAMALRTAAARPDRVAAVASFHGGGLYKDEPASPHRLLPKLMKGARLHVGHAVEDRGMPAEAIEQFDRALAAWGGAYDSEVYDGARHGWTVPDSPVYNEPQAERAYAKLKGLFDAALRPHPH
ncbi:MAG TPA: dienelactone hydrolase family protein [Vicinamibacterales bacterium]|nr:dienelactone hydrolase family protein [Vicinamibacterales bacterium]